MKQGIHPEYTTTTIVCACGNRIDTKSTDGGEIHVEICSVCHPFYTGKQRLVDTAGRVERFKRKYGDTSSGAGEAESEEKKAPAAETGGGKGAKEGKKAPAKPRGKAKAAAGAATGDEGAEAPGTDE